MKKILCVLVMTMLISVPIFSVGGAINNDENIEDVINDISLFVDKIDVNSLIAGWSEVDKLIASDGTLLDNFGYSVCVDGDYAIIGAFADNVYAGSAYIFYYDGSSWAEQQKLTASDGDSNDFFSRVSICGEYAIVGAYGDNFDSGSAYVFKRTGSSWVEQQKLTASDSAAGDRFGISVSIDGEYAVIGAYYKNGQQGAAYIFKLSGSSWVQEQKLVASDGMAGDMFGVSSSMDEEYVVIGAYGDDDKGVDSGSAYVFKRSGSSWTQTYKLIDSDGETGDFFGISVSVDGEYTIVGSYKDDSERGSVCVFERSGSSWNLIEKLIGSDSVSNDRFGSSVSMDEDYAVIGAYQHNSNQGAAYVIKNTGNMWIEEQKLFASDASLEDFFGISVAINEYNVLVGSYCDDNTNGNNAGSAYMFSRDNHAPDPPTIDGPPSGKVGDSLTYSFTSSDIDGDEVSYYIKWGDGSTSGWTSFQPSGAPGYTEDHTWSLQKTYIIEAKSKDNFGSESSWTTFDVSIPRTRVHWMQLLDMFPLLQRILNLIG